MLYSFVAAFQQKKLAVHSGKDGAEEGYFGGWGDEGLPGAGSPRRGGVALGGWLRRGKARKGLRQERRRPVRLRGGVSCEQEVDQVGEERRLAGEVRRDVRTMVEVMLETKTWPEYPTFKAELAKLPGEHAASWGLTDVRKKLLKQNKYPKALSLPDLQTHFLNLLRDAEECHAAFQAGGS